MTTLGGQVKAPCSTTKTTMKRLLYPRTAVSRSAVLTKPPGGARAAVYRWPGAVDFCAALRSYTAVSAAASGDD